MPFVPSISLESGNPLDASNGIDPECMPVKPPISEPWSRDEYDFGADSEMSIDWAAK
jgi:hypothetical protein